MNPEDMLKAVEDEESRRRASASLYEFVRQSWHVVEPGVPFVPSWHIEAICEHLEAVTHGEIRKLLINVPPRHSKSTIVSVIWPMWEWLVQPEEQFLCASYSGNLSIRDSLKSRRLVQSPWYQQRWGHMFQLSGDQNAKQRFENDHTGYRIATSVGGTATGEGGSRLILDDPHSAQEAQSDVIREGALEWFDMVWSTRLNDPKKDAMVTIMQRLHESDISGHILEDIGGWEHLKIPAEFDGVRRKTVLGEYDPRKKKGELICPARFGPEEIVILKQMLGAYGSSGQLQQDPTPAEGGVLKTKFIDFWPHSKGLPNFEYVLQSYDCAFTEKTTGDPTAMTAWGVFTHKGRHNMLLLDAWDERLSYPDMRSKAIKEWNCEYGGPSDASPYARPKRPDIALVERKASGQSLIQDLRRARIPTVSYNPGQADKMSRAHQASPILELGFVWVPESTANPGQAVSWAQDFIKQVAKFPVAPHDDYVDTFTQAVIFLKDAGWFNQPVAKDIEEPRVKVKEKVNPYAA